MYKINIMTDGSINFYLLNFILQIFNLINICVILHMCYLEIVIRMWQGRNVKDKSSALSFFIV